jgi:ketosteroid isomerase-like protein
LIGDADLCTSVYAPSGVIVPPGRQPLAGPDEIRAYWQHVIDAGGRGTSVTCESIQVRHRDFVEEGGYARFREPVALGSPLIRGSYLVLAEPQPDGRLAWVATVWTETPARVNSAPGR